MAETLKINLDKTFASLKIVSVVAGALIACFVAYANVDSRMDKLETEQATFKGIMEERTRNMSDNIDKIYDIVKDWSPDYGKTQAKAQEKTSKEI
jgi:hypothetical protein